jgi:polygalacturonase
MEGANSKECQIMNVIRIFASVMLAVVLLLSISCRKPEPFPDFVPAAGYVHTPAVTGARLPIPLPAIPPAVFNVKDSNAVGDGFTDDTAFIQKAIEDANTMGGGTVVFSGGVFLSGPIRMASRIRLQIDADAMLKMLPYERYSADASAQGGRYEPFINAYGLHDVALTGSGTIEGQGQPWWDKFKANGLEAKRPIMAMFLNSTRVLVKDVRFQNAPNIHLVISGSSDVTIDGVKVETTPASPNTDGFNVRGSNILVENCVISCGDDNIALSGPTEGVTIRNCTFLRGHGVSIGSYTRGGLVNMLVDNCTFDKTEAALRGKSDRGRGGVVRNLLYSNIKITGVKHPIFFHSGYTRNVKDPNEETIEPVTELTPVWKDVTFENITAIVPGKYGAGTLWGLPESPVENFTMRNVNITASRGFEVYYAKGVVFDKDCRINAAKGEQIITFEAKVERQSK